MEPTSQSGEALRRAVLEEGRSRAEEIRRQAQAEAEAITSTAAAQAGEIRARRLESAQAEARRRSEATLATVPVELARKRAARVEALLDEIRGAVEARVRRGGDGASDAGRVRLAADALRRMPREAVRFRIAPGERERFGAELIERVLQEPGCSGRTLRCVVDPGLPPGGLVLEDEAGARRWDLSLEARLDRCWPQLRRAIASRAQLLEEGTP